MFHFVPINPHPATGHHREVFGSFFFTPHINKYSYISISSHRSLSSYVRYTSPLTIFAALYCTLSISFLPCRTPELDTPLQMCPTNVEQRGKIICFDSLAVFLNTVQGCCLPQWYSSDSCSNCCPPELRVLLRKAVFQLVCPSLYWCTRLFLFRKRTCISLSWIPWDSYWDASKQQYNHLVYQFSSQFYVVSKLA